MIEVQFLTKVLKWGGVIIIDDACQQPGNAPSGIRPQLEASDLALRTEEEKPLINPTQQRST